MSKLYHFTSPSIIESSELALSTKNHLLNSIQIKESNNKPYKEDVSIQCNAMPWVTCSDNYYQCTIYPDIHLCPEAYAQRRFPEGTVSKDFIKIDSAKSKVRPFYKYIKTITLCIIFFIESISRLE